ncbi:MAG: GTPase Era [bacterium]|nr:GTPase Era [bacterium]
MKNTKTGFIAIVGRPNVGKSSLLNYIVGQKVAIVSEKPQTTRTRIMGVYTRDESQIVYIDTPGFHKPRNTLGEKMIKAVSSGLCDVDAVMFVVDATADFKRGEDTLPIAEQELIKVINSKKLKTILAINKIDLLKEKSELLRIISCYTKHLDFEAVVPVSAITGDGVDELINEQLEFCKESPHFFPEDVVTDQPENIMVAELIREKLLHLLDKEIPHGIAIDIESFFERDNAQGQPVLEVSAVIYCEKESHKGIIIGKRGAMLKQVGSAARKDIEEFFGCKTNLQLWVKVKENWRNRQGLIHTFGLD